MEEKQQGIHIAEMMVDISYIKKSVDSQDKTLKNFIENAPRLFASKLSEKIVYGLVGLILIGVGSAVVAGVVRATSLVINLIE